MRFSDAILLGSVMVAPRPGIRIYKTKSDPQLFGCAMGMAEVAAGVSDTSYRTSEVLWPWLRSWAPTPCGCWEAPHEETVAFTVIHLFDCHIAQDYTKHGIPRWTLEDLVEWVRTVEPKEATAEVRDVEGVGCVTPTPV